VIDHILKETYKLDAILIVSLGDVVVIADRIYAVTNEPLSHISAIHSCLSDIIIDAESHNIPPGVYSSLLEAKLLDDYRLCLDMTPDIRSIINHYISEMLGLVREKVLWVGLNSEYKLFPKTSVEAMPDRVYAVTCVKINSYATIEFRYYTKRRLV